MRRPTLVASEGARLRAEGRTGQGGSKDFHEKGDIGALATAGGQQRAFQPGGRVGRRLAVPVLRPADRDCLAAIAAQDHLGLGDGTHALVDDDCRSPFFRRYGEGKRVRAEERPRRPGRRNGGRRIRNADADQAGVGKGPDVMTEGEAIIGVAHRHCREARLACKVDQDRRTGGNGGMCEAGSCVDRDRHTARRHLGNGFSSDLSDRQVPAEDRQVVKAADAIAVGLRRGDRARHGACVFGCRTMDRQRLEANCLDLFTGGFDRCHRLAA